MAPQMLGGMNATAAIHAMAATRKAVWERAVMLQYLSNSHAAKKSQPAQGALVPDCPVRTYPMTAMSCAVG